MANAACLAIVLGPALAVALARVRDRKLWLLVGGTMVVVGAAMISGMSKGEVERIWLPFAIWLLPAGAVLAASRVRVTTEDLPGPAGEECKQLELPCGERRELAVHAGFARAEIDLEPVEVNRSRAVDLAQRRPGPAQHSLHPSGELAR